jgi:hypothetical protein
MTRKPTKKIDIVTKFRSKQISTVYDQISTIIKAARTTIVRSINTTMVQAYWHIGRHIPLIPENANL